MAARRLIWCAVAVIITVVGACEQGGVEASPASSTAAAVAIDPWFPFIAPASSEFVRVAGWVPWNEATAGEVMSPPVAFEGWATIMPASTAELLLVAVSSNTCPPIVEVAASSIDSRVSVVLTIDRYVPLPPNVCPDILQGWALGLEFAEPVDPGTVELTVADSR